MKKSVSFLLVVSLIFSLCPAFGAGVEQVSPTPPAWVEDGDYLTFPGDEVYTPENWAGVLALREKAEDGVHLPAEGRGWAQGSPGLCYETGLLRLKYAENAGTDTEEGKTAFLAAGKAFEAAESGWYSTNRIRDELCEKLTILRFRCYLIYGGWYIENWGRAIVPALDALGMTTADFFDFSYADLVAEADRAAVTAAVEAYWAFYLPEKLRISVCLDGSVLPMDTPVQVVNQRTMVPIRAVAEALGADVDWNRETWEVILTRAGDEVRLTPGETAATVNGVTVEMDVAPYADQNRTYVPLRYVSEFFGQKVNWVPSFRRVEITEDRAAAGESNLETWALGLTALRDEPGVFGMIRRGRGSALSARAALEDRFEVTNRTSLLLAIDAFSQTENNSSFLEAAGRVEGLTDREILQYSQGLTDGAIAWWMFTRDLWDKWGEKGLPACELGFVSELCQRGYAAGWLTYTEALSLWEPAAKRLTKTFSSWGELWENLADGYHWITRSEMTVKTGETGLGQTWQVMGETWPELFDDTLFDTGVIGLPGNDKK